MTPAPTRFADASALSSRERWALVAAILLLHALLGLALVRAFGGGRALAEQVGLGPVLVTMSSPDAPKPHASAAAHANEGASAAAARKASADALSSPNHRPFPAPVVAPVAGQGDALQSGAATAGQGTGGGGSGAGTGSGDNGTGSGGRVIASKPEKIAGEIAERDYPREGRAKRLGNAVIVVLTVGTDGRVSDCAVHQPSGDPDADLITCKLATERFRFHPALDQNGAPIAAPYGWKQAFFWHGNGG